MTLDADTVRWGYRLILGREPESEDVVRLYQGLDTTDGLRRALLISEEFAQVYHQLRADVIGQLDYQPATGDRVVFLHIGKAGGTTLHHALATHFAAHEICPERRNNLGSWPVGQLAEYRFFSGHFDFEMCKLVPGRPHIITLLREPTARLSSIYYFLRAHRSSFIDDHDFALARIAKENSLRDFLRRPDVSSRTDIRDGMVHILLGGNCADLVLHEPAEALAQAKANLASLTAFGILESFDQSLQLIGSALSMPMPQAVPTLQALQDIAHSDPRLEPVTKEPLTPDVTLELDRLTRLDQQLYRYACTLFRRRWIWAALTRRISARRRA